MNSNFSISSISRGLALVFFAIFAIIAVFVMDWHPKQPESQLGQREQGDYYINIISTRDNSTLETGVNSLKYFVPHEHHSSEDELTKNKKAEIKKLGDDYSLTIELTENENAEVTTNLRISHSYHNSKKESIKYNTLCSINASADDCQFHNNQFKAIFSKIDNNSFNSKQILLIALIWLIASSILIKFIFNSPISFKAIKSGSFNLWLYVSLSMILWLRLYFALIFTRIDIDPVHTTFFSCLYLVVVPALVCLYAMPIASLKRNINKARGSYLWIWVILPILLFIDIFISHVVFSSELYDTLFSAYISNVFDALKVFSSEGLKTAISVIRFKSVLAELVIIAGLFVLLIARVFISISSKKRKAKDILIPKYLLLTGLVLVFSIVLFVLDKNNPDKGETPPVEVILLLILPMFLYGLVQVLAYFTQSKVEKTDDTKLTILQQILSPTIFLDEQAENSSKRIIISASIALFILLISVIACVVLAGKDFGTIIVAGMSVFGFIMVLASPLTNANNKLRSESKALLWMRTLSIGFFCFVLCLFLGLKIYVNNNLLSQVTSTSQVVNSEKTGGYKYAVPLISSFEPPCQIPNSTTNKLSATQIHALDDCFMSKGKYANHRKMRLYGWLVGQPLNYVYSDLSFGRLQDIERLKSYNTPKSILWGDHYVLNPKYMGNRINGYQYEHISSATLTKPFGMFGIVVVLILWLNLLLSIPNQQIVARSFVASILGISFYIMCQSLNVIPFAGNNLPLMVVSSFTRDTFPILMGLIVYLVFSPSIKKG